MDFSLDWLREPEAEHALGDLLCGLIRDIQLILIQPELGNAAKLAAITEAVEVLAMAPGAEADAEADGGWDGAQSATVVVALLARNAGPATLLFEELAQEQIHIELAARANRPLTATECHELHVSPRSIGHHRSGRLRAAGTGLVAAEVSSVVIPWRLPPPARVALGIPCPGEPTPSPSALPLGKALADLGVRREPLGARLARDPDPGGDGGICVESSARMWLGDIPVALARERVTAALCLRAAARLAHVRQLVVPGVLNV
jgi:hypothetical protein